MRKELMKLGLVIVFSGSVVLTPHPAIAAAPAQAGVPLTAAGRAPLNNADVIRMLQAILGSIRSSPVKFDLSPTGLAALRQAGVSEPILNAMEQAQRQAQTPAGTPGPYVSPGIKPGQPARKLTPQQLSTVLAKVHSGKGKLSPVVANPAANQANAPILAALRQQKQTAMVQRSQAPSPAAHPAFGQPSMARTAVRAPSAPSHTNLGLQASMPLACATFGTPIIQAVSGQSGSAAVFTQDPAYNPFTIKGCNFGNVKGQAQLNFSNGRKLADLTIDTWTDNLITVEVPPSLTDVLDQPTVTLVLFPASGPQASRPGFKFYAMRREVLLASIPPSKVSLVPINDDSGSPVAPVYSSPYKGQFTGQNLGMSGGADRANNVRFPGGTDVFDFANLKPGFSIEKFQVTELSNVSGCPTFGPSTTTYYTDGGWAWQQVGNTIRVSWQEAHAHDAYYGDCSDASYGLNVWVVGPALSPAGSPWQDPTH